MSFSDILNTSFSASFLVLAIVLVRPLLKRAPRSLICALWALVAFRLLCPVLPSSPVSLVPTTLVVPEAYLSMEPAQSHVQASLEIITNPIYPQTVDISYPSSIEGLQLSDMFWTLNWLVGAGVMTLYALWSYLSLLLKTRVSVRLRDNILLCDDIGTPFILGLFRPRICLPSAMSPEQMEPVLAHEQAHLKRLDHLWKPMGYLLLTVHWFNPVMWLAYCLLCRDIELACDERVIRGMEPSQIRAYSEALISWGTRTRHIAACPLAFGEVGVMERVKNMLNYRKPGFWILMTAVLLSILIVVCFVFDPMPTTVGNFREHGFSLLFSDPEDLTCRRGDQEYLIQLPVQFAMKLKQIAIDPAEVSKSLAEDRDRTYEIIDGNTTLCISADCSEIWVDDGVKPTYSYRVKKPEELKKLLADHVTSVKLSQYTTVDSEAIVELYASNGFQERVWEQVELPLTLDLSQLPSAVYTLDTGHGMDFETGWIVVYEDETTVISLHYADRQDDLLRCRFQMVHKTLTGGSILLPYQLVQDENGQLGVKGTMAEVVSDYGIEMWGYDPSLLAFGVYIPVSVAETGETITFTVNPMYRLTYSMGEIPWWEQPSMGTWVPYRLLYQNTDPYFMKQEIAKVAYRLGYDRFETEDDSGGLETTPVVWNWKKLTEENALLMDALGECTGVSSRGAVYQTVDEERHLIWTDGQLLLVQTRDTLGGPKMLWCVEQLVPFNAMGEAHWVYDPSVASQPGFGFDIDMDYTHVTVSTTAGQLLSVDKRMHQLHGPGEQVEINSGYSIFWIPTGGQGNFVSGAYLPIQVWNGDEMICSGTLWITGGDETDPGQGRRNYTATVIGEGLTITQNMDFMGGLVQFDPK